MSSVNPEPAVKRPWSLRASRDRVSVNWRMRVAGVNGHWSRGELTLLATALPLGYDQRRGAAAGRVRFAEFWFGRQACRRPRRCIDARRHFTKERQLIARVIEIGVIGMGWMDCGPAAASL